jgi:hypothetical protein
MNIHPMESVAPFPRPTNRNTITLRHAKYGFIFSQALSWNPTTPFFGFHSRLKGWIFHFHGVATHYLANCLGWFRWLD